MILSRTYSGLSFAPRLSFYLTVKYLKSLLGMLALCVGLIFIVDLIELFRRTGDQSDSTTWQILAISLLRLPSYIEELLPFAVLFGSMASLLTLSKKSELTIIRSVGLSAWQFLMPYLITTFILGLIGMIAFNPLAANLKEKADTRQAVLFGMDEQTQQNNQNQWLRQKGYDGPSIMRAGTSYHQGQKLLDVTFYTFNPQHVFIERIDAQSAELKPGHWLLKQATITRQNEQVELFDIYEVSTFLNEVQVRESFAVANAISFWNLPNYIKLAQKAGLKAYQYRLQYQSLMARPLLLCAMVLVAATVSLRLFRYGGIGQLIVSGIIAGFMLYAINEIMEDVGGAGLIPPFIAAWFPAIIACILGCLALLHLEDS